MSRFFYPRKVIVPAEATPNVSDADLIARIIEAREDGKSRAEAVGGVLQGASNVQGFYRVWDMVERERQRMAAIDPATCKDAADYWAKLKDSPTSVGDAGTWTSAAAMAAGGILPYGAALED